ncbi:NusG domain II-containing protein [Streptococcus phocae]|uniref:Uncharacterized protein n=1 Tax=Streptococcus phocae TaxID=119224 RepID=A0A0P6SFJ6_9STRE|nr:NusG domain II-containing protein [Streptococcus phocae]KPJ23159.1 hypothetical protein AKK44_00610 [Streptococcus phocae]
MKTTFKKIISYFKPYDYIFLLLSIVISCLPLIITSYKGSSVTDATVAIVKINGKIVDRFSLQTDGPHIEKTYYPQKGHYNIIEVKGNQIRVKEDNSPDQIAVKTGWIDTPGQLSVCLPHQLIIEIQGTNRPQKSPKQEDDLILPL